MSSAVIYKQLLRSTQAQNLSHFVQRNLSVACLLNFKTASTGIQKDFQRQSTDQDSRLKDTPIHQASDTANQFHPGLHSLIDQFHFKNPLRDPKRPLNSLYDLFAQNLVDAMAKGPSGVSGSDAPVGKDLRHLSLGDPASPPSKEWLIHIPDKPNALEKRLKARPLHLESMRPTLDAGLLVVGGATLTEHPEEGQTPDMTGSVLILKAESREKALEWIRNDPYTKEGAWDVENATIWPFKSAVRVAL